MHTVFAVLVLACAAGRVAAESGLLAALGKDYDVGRAVRVVRGMGHGFSTAVGKDDGGRMVHETAVSFEITAFGEELTLDLVQNTALFAPGYVERTYNAAGEIVAEARGRENCYYLGTVRGHPDSVVAMSTCEGLSGFLRLDRDAEEIHTEPAHRHLAQHARSNPRRAAVAEVAQLFYRESAARRDAHDECGGGSAPLHPPESDGRGGAEAPGSARRSGTNFVEWAIVNDYAQATWCAGAAECESAEARAADLANNVAGRYRDTDGGFTPPAEIVLVEQRTWAGGDPIAVTGDIAATLAAFLAWRNDVAVDFDKDFNDAVHLLSHVDFDGATVGLAYSSTVCKSTGAAVSQDRGSIETASNTMAHELGHNLGMTHDGATTCTIMAACACGQECTESGNTTNHWSNASKEAYAAYAATVTCMANDPGAVACADLPPLGAWQTAGSCVAGAPPDTVCELGCEAGTVPVGDLETTCVGGAWTTVSGGCAVACETAAALPQADEGSCTAGTLDGTVCSMMCIEPFLPFSGGSVDSSSSMDLPGLMFMCDAGAWLGPAGDVLCYYETAIDASGLTAIGPSDIAITLAPTDVSGSATLTLTGAGSCPPLEGFTATTDVVDIGLGGGALVGDAEIGVDLPFLAGVTFKGRKRSQLRYCDPNANGGEGKWRRNGPSDIDHDALILSGAIPYPTAVMGWARDGPVIIEPAGADESQDDGDSDSVSDTVIIGGAVGGIVAAAVIVVAAMKNHDRKQQRAGVSPVTDVAMTAAPLPDGWESFIDEFGERYYHNASMGKSTWERPE